MTSPIKRKLPFKYRLLAFFVLITFTSTNQFSTSAIASPSQSFVNSKELSEDLNSIKLPVGMGKIQEVYKGKAREAVIVVQDAHAVPDAQKSIQKIIGYFQNEYGLSFIGLEGASSKLDLQVFKSFPDKEILKRTFNDYLEKGELSGAVVSAVFNNSLSDYKGVENWNLYEKGLRFYLKALNSSQPLLEKISLEKLNIQTRKRTIYSKKLFQIDESLESFLTNGSDLLSTLSALSKIKSPETGSELAILLEEGNRRYVKQIPLEVEVKKISKVIEKHLKTQSGLPQSKEKLRGFYEKVQEFQTSRISAQELALFLKELAVRESVNIKISNEMSRSTHDQKKLKDIEGTKFLQDFENYSGSIKETLFRNDNERKLDEESRKINLLEKLVRLELSRQDWEKAKVSLNSPESSILEKEALQPYVDFYENAESRDQTFTRNLVLEMRRKKLKSSLLVAGGFHSDGVLQYLKRKNISYLLVMPGMNSIPEKSHYLDCMKGNVSWRNYFEIENSRINLYKAFVRGARDLLLTQVKVDTKIFLKDWRDQMIYDLAKNGKLSTSSSYTSFIDELNEKKFSGPFKKIDQFIEKLRVLESQGKLTDQGVMNLLKPATIPFPVPAIGSLLEGGIFDNSNRSEARMDARPVEIADTTTVATNQNSVSLTSNRVVIAAIFRILAMIFVSSVAVGVAQWFGSLFLLVLVAFFPVSPFLIEWIVTQIPESSISNRHHNVARVKIISYSIASIIVGFYTATFLSLGLAVLVAVGAFATLLLAEWAYGIRFHSLLSIADFSLTQGISGVRWGAASALKVVILRPLQGLAFLFVKGIDGASWALIKGAGLAKGYIPAPVFKFAIAILSTIFTLGRVGSNFLSYWVWPPIKKLLEKILIGIGILFIEIISIGVVISSLVASSKKRASFLSLLAIAGAIIWSTEDKKIEVDKPGSNQQGVTKTLDQEGPTKQVQMAAVEEVTEEMKRAKLRVEDSKRALKKTENDPEIKKSVAEIVEKARRNRSAGESIEKGLTPEEAVIAKTILAEEDIKRAEASIRDFVDKQGGIEQAKKALEGKPDAEMLEEAERIAKAAKEIDKTNLRKDVAELIAAAEKVSVQKDLRDLLNQYRTPEALKEAMGKNPALRERLSSLIKEYVDVVADPRIAEIGKMAEEIEEFIKVKGRPPTQTEQLAILARRSKGNLDLDEMIKKINTLNLPERQRRAVIRLEAAEDIVKKDPDVGKLLSAIRAFEELRGNLGLEERFSSKTDAASLILWLLQQRGGRSSNGAEMSFEERIEYSVSQQAIDYFKYIKEVIEDLQKLSQKVQSKEEKEHIDRFTQTFITYGFLYNYPGKSEKTGYVAAVRIAFEEGHPIKVGLIDYENYMRSPLRELVIMHEGKHLLNPAEHYAQERRLEEFHFLLSQYPGWVDEILSHKKPLLLEKMLKNPEFMKILHAVVQFYIWEEFEAYEVSYKYLSKIFGLDEYKMLKTEDNKKQYILNFMKNQKIDKKEYDSVKREIHNMLFYLEKPFEARKEYFLRFPEMRNNFLYPQLYYLVMGNEEFLGRITMAENGEVRILKPEEFLSFLQSKPAPSKQEFFEELPPSPSESDFSRVINRILNEDQSVNPGELEPEVITSRIRRIEYDPRALEKLRGDDNSNKLDAMIGERAKDFIRRMIGTVEKPGIYVQNIELLTTQVNPEGRLAVEDAIARAERTMVAIVSNPYNKGLGDSFLKEAEAFVQRHGKGTSSKDRLVTAHFLKLIIETFGTSKEAQVKYLDLIFNRLENLGEDAVVLIEPLFSIAILSNSQNVIIPRIFELYDELSGPNARYSQHGEEIKDEIERTLKRFLPNPLYPDKTIVNFLISHLNGSKEPFIAGVVVYILMESDQRRAILDDLFQAQAGRQPRQAIRDICAVLTPALEEQNMKLELEYEIKLKELYEAFIQELLSKNIKNYPDSVNDKDAWNLERTLLALLKRNPEGEFSSQLLETTFANLNAGFIHPALVEALLASKQPQIIQDATNLLFDGSKDELLVKLMKSLGPFITENYLDEALRIKTSKVVPQGEGLREFVLGILSNIEQEDEKNNKRLIHLNPDIGTQAVHYSSPVAETLPVFWNAVPEGLQKRVMEIINSEIKRLSGKEKWTAQDSKRHYYLTHFLYEAPSAVFENALDSLLSIRERVLDREHSSVDISTIEILIYSLIPDWWDKTSKESIRKRAIFESKMTKILERDKNYQSVIWALGFFKANKIQEALINEKREFDRSFAIRGLRIPNTKTASEKLIAYWNSHPLEHDKEYLVVALAKVGFNSPAANNAYISYLATQARNGGLTAEQISKDYEFNKHKKFDQEADIAIVISHLAKVAQSDPKVRTEILKKIEALMRVNSKEIVYLLYSLSTLINEENVFDFFVEIARTEKGDVQKIALRFLSRLEEPKRAYPLFLDLLKNQQTADLNRHFIVSYFSNREELPVELRNILFDILKEKQINDENYIKRSVITFFKENKANVEESVFRAIVAVAMNEDERLNIRLEALSCAHAFNKVSGDVAKRIKFFDSVYKLLGHPNIRILEVAWEIYSDMVGFDKALSLNLTWIGQELRGGWPEQGISDILKLRRDMVTFGFFFARQRDNETLKAPFKSTIDALIKGGQLPVFFNNVPPLFDDSQALQTLINTPHTSKENEVFLLLIAAFQSVPNYVNSYNLTQDLIKQFEHPNKNVRKAAAINLILQWDEKTFPSGPYWSQSVFKLFIKNPAFLQDDQIKAALNLRRINERNAIAGVLEDVIPIHQTPEEWAVILSGFYQTNPEVVLQFLKWKKEKEPGNYELMTRKLPSANNWLNGNSNSRLNSRPKPQNSNVKQNLNRQNISAKKNPNTQPRSNSRNKTGSRSELRKTDASADLGASSKLFSKVAAVVIGGAQGLGVDASDVRRIIVFIKKNGLDQLRDELKGAVENRQVDVLETQILPSAYEFRNKFLGLDAGKIQTANSSIVLAVYFPEIGRKNSFFELLLETIIEAGNSAKIFSDEPSRLKLMRRMSRKTAPRFHIKKLRGQDINSGIADEVEYVPIALDKVRGLGANLQGFLIDDMGLNTEDERQAAEVLNVAFLVKLAQILADPDHRKNIRRRVFQAKTKSPKEVKAIVSNYLKSVLIYELNKLNYSDMAQAVLEGDFQTLIVRGDAFIRMITREMNAHAKIRTAA